jgi:hypothetical protein
VKIYRRTHNINHIRPIERGSVLYEFPLLSLARLVLDPELPAYNLNYTQVMLSVLPRFLSLLSPTSEHVMQFYHLRCISSTRAPSHATLLTTHFVTVATQ